MSPLEHSALFSHDSVDYGLSSNFQELKNLESPVYVVVVVDKDKDEDDKGGRRDLGKNRDNVHDHHSDHQGGARANAGRGAGRGARGVCCSMG